MKELPNPTMPLSLIDMPRGSLHRSDSLSKKIDSSSEKSKNRPRLTTEWARHQDQVREAQKLRYEIFVLEMGARLKQTIPGHDIDLFDDFCEHLLVRDEESGQVVGTYRVLTPVQAKRIGCTYTDLEFDLTRLRGYRERMVELGRSCVHADHRHGGVIMALWGALAEFMVRNNLEVMIGCASIPMLHQGVVSGEIAANIWRQLQQTHLADVAHQVTPRLALPIENWPTQTDYEPPALIKGYLRLGAKVLGAPAWDPDFNTADLPMMMKLQDMPARYRKHFLGVTN